MQERASGRHSWNNDLPQIRGGARYRVENCSHCETRSSIASQVPNQMAPERCAQLTTCQGQCHAPGAASEAVVSFYFWQVWSECVHCCGREAQIREPRCLSSHHQGLSAQQWPQTADVESRHRFCFQVCTRPLLQQLMLMRAVCRRIPLLPEHRQYAWIAFRHDGQIRLAKHLTCMFGAVSSVHNWERVGEQPATAMPSICNAPATRTAPEGPGKEDITHSDMQICR